MVFGVGIRRRVHVSDHGSRLARLDLIGAYGSRHTAAGHSGVAERQRLFCRVGEAEVVDENRSLRRYAEVHHLLGKQIARAGPCGRDGHQCRGDGHRQAVHRLVPPCSIAGRSPRTARYR